eukprot:TRINITY_DN13731_c0_g1_i2.p1 TRINITY_DN13731_c0_g1~~TRINITY_DN13731_c0_g1_i2.p1  ORF type:complete len:329 (-),score=59.02 TRINITY_DN13731_c0_g1_i2:263-1249(-)
MPNRNSYLALGLGIYDRDALHAAAVACEDAAARQGCVFDAMDYEDLHVTFLFVGEMLRKLSAAQLEHFHQRVAQVVRSADLALQRLPLDGLDLFPPGKQNLIVARFKAPQGLVALQRAVVQIARESGIASDSERKRLFGENGYLARAGGGREDTWTPHCTLGKLRAPSTQVTAIGQAVIREIESSTDLVDLHTTGIVMCGEVPKQLWIDWECTLTFFDCMTTPAVVCTPEGDVVLNLLADVHEDPSPGEAQSGVEGGTCVSCVGSTQQLQALAAPPVFCDMAESTAQEMEAIQFKRSVSFYLGTGASQLVEAVGMLDEDHESDSAHVV